MSLFLYLSCILLGWYCQKNVVKVVEAQKKIQRVEGSHIGGLSIKGGGGEGWGSGSNLIHTREKESKALLWLSGHDFAG